MSIIEVNNVTKEFRLGVLHGFKQTIQDVIGVLSGKTVPQRTLFKALDDVSFSVEDGEVLGIIGHNGAGKSTLLKMLSRISTPSSGSVKVNGRIAPLIEVGAGFVPEFTGRENVYLNGTILGMSRKEIDKKFDEIVDFAELSNFIDTPVKRYSSGMQVKLAFAVATSIDAEILIVDEVLAVGDLAFQRKCFDRMEDLIKRHGRTVLIVSHNIRQVERLCTRAMLLDRGRILQIGAPNEICNLFYKRSDDKISANLAKAGVGAAKFQQKTGEIDLLDVNFVDDNNSLIDAVPFRDDMIVTLSFQVYKPLQKVAFGIGIHTTDFIYLTSLDSEGQLAIPEMEPGIHKVKCKINQIPLLPGIYSLRISVNAGIAALPIFYAENLAHFHVVENSRHRAPISRGQGFFSLKAGWEIDKSEIATG